MKVYLLKGKEFTVNRGHPWIFPKAIAKTQGHIEDGSLVEVYNHAQELIAYGVFNANSLYRVRVLLMAWEQIDPTIEAIVTHRLVEAKQCRELLQLAAADTNAFRLFNSEADGLSGLTIDHFNDYLVISSSAYWVEANREIIENAIHKLYPEKHLQWQPQIKLLAKEGYTGELRPVNEAKTIVKEAGIQFEVEMGASQKTGLFLDQRENHQRLATMVRDRSVLDLYTYTGGFALHAARGGAAHVIAVDSSANAIAQAQQNAALNNLNHIEFIEADARDYLAKAGDFEVVILDPPKLVPGRAHLPKAKNYYRFLHREVFKVMKPGSVLVTCNCSSALNASMFVELIETQAREMHRNTRITGVYGAASCHPILAAFPEGHYLTTVFMTVL